ncbi:Protein zwilch-like protein, partial [Stegodyphus mimosarum]
MMVHDKLESFDCAVLEACRNLDFTDKLWLILKECSSIEELIEALTYVFNALKEVNPPLIYEKKKSTVAVIARNLQKMPLSCPVVDEKLAKQMLLEIGIEKLQQDYVAIFVGMELASLEETNYFLQQDLFSPEAISCIKKFHCMLELTIIGLKSLGLCQMLLRELVRSAIRHYASTSDIDLQHFFSFQIPLYVIRPLLNKLRPTIWELSLLSSDGDYMKQSVHHFVTTPTVEHIFAPKSY